MTTNTAADATSATERAHSYAKIISADTSWSSCARIEAVADEHRDDPRIATIAEELRATLTAQRSHRNHLETLAIASSVELDLDARFVALGATRRSALDDAHHIGARTGTATQTVLTVRRQFHTVVAECTANTCEHAHTYDEALARAARSIVESNADDDTTRTQRIAVAVELTERHRARTREVTDTAYASLTGDTVHLMAIRSPDLLASAVDNHPWGELIWRHARITSSGTGTPKVAVVAPAALTLCGHGVDSANNGDLDRADRQLDYAWSSLGDVTLDDGVDALDLARTAVALGGDTRAVDALEVLTHQR